MGSGHPHGPTVRNRRDGGKNGKRSGISGVAAAVITLLVSTAGSALAHRDTMDVPVIPQARQTLETGAGGELCLQG